MEKFPYEDIINAEAPTLTTRKPMPISDRAAQFSPFAAVVGHDAAIEETARLTDCKAELSEDIIAQLDEKLRILLQNINDNPCAAVTYFVPDERKQGGSYVTKSGIVCDINQTERTVVFEDGTEINIDDIFDISVENTLSPTNPHIPPETDSCL